VAALPSPDAIQAWTFYNQGERQAASDLMTRVVEGRRRVLGEEHPDTQVSIESLRHFENEAES
jgi:hypothetical protein